MPLYAHTPAKDSEHWQLLEEHLKNTAELAASFAEHFDSSDVGRCLGWFHDLGKASPEFQNYLRECHKATLQGKKHHSGRIDHKLAGAVLAKSIEGLSGLALPVLGHHGGLCNPAVAKSKTSDPAELKRVDPVLKIAPDLIPLALTYDPLPSQFTKSSLAIELYLRMLYSCLVDADYLDTESHWEPDRTQKRTPGQPLAQLWDIFQKNQAALVQKTKETAVNRVRQEIYSSCLASAISAPGVFRLTVPTGGGKTRSGMAFALKHAVEHNLRRVIVAIPYTSIIDQNAKEYKDIFGAQNVLEHHSAIATPDSDQYSEEQMKMELATENWDMPIVVTTTVQLFESLFSNKPSRCRKLHNIARSVIILDEVQTLPLGLLQPIMNILNELVENYGVTLVLSTATQPALSGSSPYLQGFPNCTEIVPNPKQYFDILKRVEYRVQQQPWSWDRVAESIMERQQVLCVLNSRKDAVMLLNMLDCPDALHLSTLMCPAHRREVLAEIHSRLQNKLPCRVVSTQVVEAGVDLDFPCVMRAIGPLDRIVQAAGRCNREGLMDDMGEVIVFEPEEGRAPRGEYGLAMNVSSIYLAEHGDRLADNHVMEHYFNELYQAAQIKGLDKKGINALREEGEYGKVAALAKLIKNDMVPLIITKYKPEKIMSIWSGARHNGFLSREDRRLLQQYTVNVYANDFIRYKADGFVEEVVAGVNLWKGAYDEKYGMLEGMFDPCDFIVAENDGR